ESGTLFIGAGLSGGPRRLARGRTAPAANCRRRKMKKRNPTIGVLAGWQWYEGVTLHRYLESVFHGIRAAAMEKQCHLLAACGAGLMKSPATTTTWSGIRCS